ncbi:hypothetical protein [uncultured Clostridium sp.]|uniref:hypothetical protein n=1 Tax=uncultured Clostridium sp. TaxID=59620 RepID=UPI002627E489|nr:hypothetical protein [uncultured Clostridium sp.]
MIEKLWDALEKIAQSTGVAVEKLYVLLEQQAKVQLACDILLVIGIIVVIIAGVIFSKYCFKRKNEDGRFSDWETPAIISTVLTGTLGIFGGFCLLPCLIEEIIQILINPPVWILEYVMKLIK